MRSVSSELLRKEPRHHYLNKRYGSFIEAPVLLHLSCYTVLRFHVAVACMACLQFQGTLSLNAAIFAAVLLASRLESNEKVFGLVLFALELFAFFPLAR